MALAPRPHHPAQRRRLAVPLNPRGGRPYWRLQARVHAEETTCVLCGLPVLKHLRGTNHPLEPTIEHLVPLKHGGDPLDRSNCGLSCRCCNTSRGTRTVAEASPRCRELSLKHRQALQPAALHPW